MDDSGGSGYDVLVVDDNPADRRFITEALGEAEFDLTVHVAETRAEALDLLDQRGECEAISEPDAILLDWNLSRETGEEVVNAAKSGDTRVPVLVMTGAASEIEAVTSSLSRADSFMAKPTNPEAYVDALRALLTDQ